MPNETGSQTDDQDKGKTDGGEGQGGGDAALDPKLNAAINAAVTSHIKRQFKGLPDMFGKLLDERFLAAGITKPAKGSDGGDGTDEETQTGARVAPKSPAKGADGKGQDRGGDGGEGGKGAGADGGELEALRAEVAKTNRAMKDLRRETAEKERAATEKEAFSEVKSRLTGKVRPEALETAMKLLRADGRIAIEKDGSVQFVDGDERLDLDEGLEQWLKTPEGAMFVPPPSGRQGSLSGANRRPAAKPVPRAGGSGDSMTPAQKTAAQFAKLGINL